MSPVLPLPRRSQFSTTAEERTGKVLRKALLVVVGAKESPGIDRKPTLPNAELSFFYQLIETLLRYERAASLSSKRIKLASHFFIVMHHHSATAFEESIGFCSRCERGTVFPFMPSVSSKVPCFE